MTPSPPPALELRAVSLGDAVRDVTASFPAGAFHVLRGAADCGAEEMLRLLGLLERPDEGDVLLRGRSTCRLDEAARAGLRNRECGFVFAAPFLLAGFSIIENVAMPLFKISQVGPEAARRRTLGVLDFVGLGALVEAPAAELPPADQRRVALARALVNEPTAIFVEHLDGGFAAADVQDFAVLLRNACDRYGVAVIATATSDFAPASADRVLEMAEGAIQRDSEAVRGW